MSLTYDPDVAIAALCRSDKALARVIREAGPFTMRPERIVSPFAALLKAITSQQLSGKAAATIFGRLVALFPDPKRLDPQVLLTLPVETLRGVGLSGAKAAAVCDLAAKTIDGTVPTMRKLRGMSDDEIVDRLVQVRGIGRWSVEMLLIFKLGRPDVFPIDDLGVRRGIMITYGHSEMRKPRDLDDIGDRWRPYRSVASWYMWRATELPRAKPAKAVEVEKSKRAKIKR